MHSKTNRTNHDFQIVHFLVGACHTADGAYALLCDLHEDRDNALKSFEASHLREKAKILRANKVLNNSTDEAEKLEARADIVEIEALSATVARNLAAAKAELTTIETCMARIEHLRRFKHLPAAQAHEAAQADEWKFELINRAENHILTTGRIPTDHFATMRMHPAFESDIYPAVRNIETAILQGKAGDYVTTKSKNDSPLMLAVSDLLQLEAPNPEVVQ